LKIKKGLKIEVRQVGRQGLAKANEKKKRKNLFKERKKMEEK